MNGKTEPSPGDGTPRRSRLYRHTTLENPRGVRGPLTWLLPQRPHPPNLAPLSSSGPNRFWLPPTPKSTQARFPAALESPNLIVPLSLSLPLPLCKAPLLLSAWACSHRDPDTTPASAAAPFFPRPCPSHFLAPLSPPWSRPSGSGPAPSSFPPGRPKSLVSTPLGSLQHPSPSPGPAPPRSGPPLSPRPPAAPPPAASASDAQVAAARLLKRQELPRPPRAAPGPSARCSQPLQSGPFLKP
ncbi:extensin-like [Cricetulus griseus]|uniref:extensin-like n=1 Tax=Cricetulus griseus TaxID=10029 RepID=UPI0015C37CAF|nr:extensin-like [Cricetulus griseus]